MPAPIVSEGANTPAGTPVQADSQVAQNFSSVNSAGSSSCPSSRPRVGA